MSTPEHPDRQSSVFDIVLFEPEIPPNTGNVMRLCANTGCRLHLVRPLGFSMSDKQLQRAGMDYRARIDYTLHDSWQQCKSTLTDRRMFAVSTRGAERFDRIRYQTGDTFVFGPETRGLPQPVLDEFPIEQRIRLPMATAGRSLNLSNTVGIVIYEAWRQLEYAGAI